MPRGYAGFRVELYGVNDEFCGSFTRHDGEGEGVAIRVAVAETGSKLTRSFNRAGR